jgi:hypothetical protein
VVGARSGAADALLRLKVIMELPTRKLDIRIRRALISIGLSVSLACWANELLGWGFFRGSDQEVSLVAFAALAVILYLFWVSPDETRAYRAARLDRND